MACEFCLREKPLTGHHLIPRTLHSNKWFEKNFTKADMRSRQVNLCEDCHMAIHRFHSEKELGRSFNTKESLLADEKVANFVKWIAKKA